MKKSNNKQITEGKNKAKNGKSYVFPEHNISVNASSLQEAQEKLEALLEEGNK